jgi:hypothetical protein
MTRVTMDKVEGFMVFPPPSRMMLAVASEPTIERIGGISP